MGYKEKLVQFNKTANYNNEMRFMMGLIEPDENEIIIDYGCGTGYMMERIKELSGVQCFGYDVTDYSIHSVDNMLNALPDSIDKVYFMHSFAHIPNPVDVLRDIFNRMEEGGRLYVMTPNADWLDELTPDPNYVPDPTVFKHYNKESIFQVMNEGGFLPLFDGQIGSYKNGKCERYWGVYHKKYKTIW